MRKIMLLPAIAGCLCIACNNGPVLHKNDEVLSVKTSANDASTDKSQTDQRRDPKPSGPSTEVNREIRTVSNPEGPKLLNQIDMRTSGNVHVAQAYLIYGDNESLVPATNETTINRPIKLLINLDKGWQQDASGQVSIGAYEKIEASTGEVLLSSEDLFKDYPSISATDANVIKLKAVITQLNKPVDYFLVTYKVWDKKGDGQITGSYKFRITQ
jgi:hypothetical protein